MSARLRYLCVFVMVLIAAAMLIGLANAKTGGGGHHAKTQHKPEAEHEEPQVGVAKTPGDPEAEQKHTNTYLSGKPDAASEAKPGEPETYGTARLALELCGVMLVGAALVKVSASRK